MAHSTFKSWDPLDQAKALSWARRQAETCSGCGFHPDQTDPDRGGDPEAFELGSRLCTTCEQSEKQRDQFHKTRAPGEHQVWRRRAPVERTGPAED